MTTRPTGAWNFNPRPLAGATIHHIAPRLCSRISIHAPLRGRLVTNLYEDRVGEFQSTPPCGGDNCLSIKRLNLTKFQSTPPCGGDSGPPRRIWVANHFNPRPLAGATPGGGICPRFLWISIHAPLRGRLRGADENPEGIYFNPRPLAGATTGPPHPWNSRSYFNPRPLAGATVIDYCLFQFDIISIHAPLRGRHRKEGNRMKGRWISIHAPLRGRRGSATTMPGRSYFNPRPLAGATYNTGL